MLAAITAISTAAALAALVDRIRLRHALIVARHAATHDALTGLRNRVGLAEAWRCKPGAMVALLDLDDFKPINDQHGHDAGDHVLTVVAARITTPGVVAARLGGDEFALLIYAPLPEYLLTGLAAAVAKPICLPDGVTTVAVTASIGLAHTTADLTAALGQADAAMYRVKTTVAKNGLAVFDARRDDRPTVEARPAHRVRDLTDVLCRSGETSTVGLSGS